MDDHLTIAHVVFFELRAGAHPAQLNERVARLRFVCSQRDLVMIRGGHQTELDELWIGQKVHRHQVGSRLLEGGVLLLQDAPQRAVQTIGDLARGVPDHFVHVRK